MAGDAELVVTDPVRATRAAMTVTTAKARRDFFMASPSMAAGPRQVYGVVSPEDLPAYLQALPPAAVLVGFEIDNEGFSLDDPGGLEIPLEEYAREHEYQRTSIECPVCARKVLSVWERIPEADPPG